MTNKQGGSTGVSEPAVTQTVLASRALLGYVARSLEPVLEQMTLTQFRVLVVLSGVESSRMADLAELVGVHPSTLSRTVERLAQGGWIERTVAEENRREVRVSLTPESRKLISDVTRRRRRELATVLDSLDADDRAAVERGMAIFAVAAGEQPPQDLALLGL